MSIFYYISRPLPYFDFILLFNNCYFHNTWDVDHQEDMLWQLLKLLLSKRCFFFLLSLVNVVLTSEIQYEPALFVAYMYFSCWKFGVRDCTSVKFKKPDIFIQPVCQYLKALINILSYVCNDVHSQCVLCVYLYIS